MASGHLGLNGPIARSRAILVYEREHVPVIRPSPIVRVSLASATTLTSSHAMFNHAVIIELILSLSLSLSRYHENLFNFGLLTRITLQRTQRVYERKSDEQLQQCLCSDVCLVEL